MDPRHATGPAPHRALTRIVVGVVLAILATLVLQGPAGASPAAEVDPSQDVPSLPQECIRYAIIPPVPVACHLTPYRAKRPTVVLWGDSHAWQHIPAVRNAAIARGANLTAFVLGGCPPVKVPIDRAPRNPKSCATNNYLAMKYVMRLQRGDQDVRVLLGSHWAGYRRAAPLPHPAMSKPTHAKTDPAVNRATLVRLTQIHEKLCAVQPNGIRRVNRKTLKRDLGVSISTITRDMEVLAVQFGAPSEWDGRRQSYHYRTPFELRPLLWLNGEQMLSLVMASRVFAAWRGF
eukprot:gene48965-59946_t